MNRNDTINILPISFIVLIILSIATNDIMIIMTTVLSCSTLSVGCYIGYELAQYNFNKRKTRREPRKVNSGPSDFIAFVYDPSFFESNEDEMTFHDKQEELVKDVDLSEI